MPTHLVSNCVTKYMLKKKIQWARETGANYFIIKPKVYINHQIAGPPQNF